jgi:hypothetical protein
LQLQPDLYFVARDCSPPVVCEGDGRMRFSIYPGIPDVSVSTGGSDGNIFPRARGRRPNRMTVVDDRVLLEYVVS